MSQATSGFPGPEQHGGAQGSAALAAGYIPNEDEVRVFKECNQESFWYRSLPFSAIGVAVTQVLISRGIIAPSPRFGALPKVAIVGMMSYMVGKMSYMRVCQEKFKNLENSPLGDALRQRTMSPVFPGSNQSEMADPDQAAPADSAFESTHQPAMSYQPPADSYSYSSDYSSPSQSSYDPAPFSSSFSESAPSGVREDDLPQAVNYLDDDLPKKKPVLYEDLRSKNRENYEVTLTQKAETLLKPQAEVAAAAPKKDGKKNKYGDAWEE